MKKGNVKLFGDQTALCKLLNLRLNGYSSSSLAIFFHCHRSSIEAQLAKYGITAEEDNYTVDTIASNVLFKLVPPEPKWDKVDGIRFSKGKSYKDYLKESQFHRINIRIA